MKYATVILFFLITFSSCSKDDADFDGNLTGKWNVTKVEGQQYVNGNAGIYLQDNSPTGYIEFKSNGKGEQNYSFTLFGTSYPQVANFTYTSTENSIIVKRFGEDDLVWNRLTNETNIQVASYEIPVDASTTIEYTLTLEKN